MNFEKYPWLLDLDSDDALHHIRLARKSYLATGAVTFPNFMTAKALAQCVQDARAQEDSAYTTDDTHTPHLLPYDDSTYPSNSVRNHKMRTQVASIAYDELPPNSELAALYQHPSLIGLVGAITGKLVTNNGNGTKGEVKDDGSDIPDDKLYLSEDPIGACTINVFRPGFHHSFHFDESVFSTSIMLQEAEKEGSGLFQYTHPLRQNDQDLALHSVAEIIQTYDPKHVPQSGFEETHRNKANTNDDDTPLAEKGKCPILHTLAFEPGTLSIFSGSRSLHRVTKIEGNRSRLTAILTFATKPGFRNSKEVQELFWGRSSV